MRTMLLALCAFAITTPQVRAQMPSLPDSADHTFAEVPWGASAQRVKALLTATNRRSGTGTKWMPWEEGLHYVRTDANGDLVFSKSSPRLAITRSLVTAHLPNGKLASVDVSLTIEDSMDRTRMFDLLSRLTTLMWGEPRNTQFQMGIWYWNDPGGQISMRTVDTGIHMNYESADAKRAAGS